MQTNEITPIKINLGKDTNNIKLYILSDAHIGDTNFDLELLKQITTFIAETPNCYCILLGDLLNTALKTSKSDIYSETLNVAESQKLAVKMLTPIKDKILAITPGNHENRVWREAAVDISLWLAEKLGLEDRYRNNAVALNVKFGKNSKGNQYSLNVFCQHGEYGGGRRLGSAMNSLEDLDGMVGNADIFCRAHTHQPIQGSRKIFLFNQYGNIDTHIKYYFNAPSLLKYGGYACNKGFRPTDNSPCYLNVRAYSKREGSRSCNYFKIDKICL